MKFTKLLIDGYGRFNAREIVLEPGLQIIAGPNEQGKSTARHFITDMLYGQKRSRVQRLYDDGNRARTPWNKENGYGGRIEYTLDSGRLFEVQRSFDREDEWIQIFDRTDGRETTQEFDTLRNRESTFAERHLKMSKAVFLGMATITHVTLSELGDKHALEGIRDKLLALADTGNENTSAEDAEKWLHDRMANIGMSTARTKPLPLARTRLMDLQKEYEQVRAARDEIVTIENQRLEVQSEIQDLEVRRDGFARELSAHEQTEHAEKLRKAEELASQIAILARACAPHRALGEFPLHEADEVVKTAALVSTHKDQLDRTTVERDELARQLDGELHSEAANEDVPMADPDAAYEEQLMELESKIHRLTDKAEETEASRVDAEASLEQVREELSKLPDFSQFARDPVQWLSELAGSYEKTRSAAEDERNQLRRLEEARDHVREAVDEHDASFREHENLPKRIAEYGVTTHDNAQSMLDLEAEVEKIRNRAEELGSRVPGFVVTAALCAAGAAALIAAGIANGNPGIFIAAGCVGLLLGYSTLAALLSRSGARRAQRRLAETNDTWDSLRATDQHDRAVVEGLLEQTGCETVRELEALHERYARNLEELAGLESEHAAQHDAVQEADERLGRRLKTAKESFGRLGETVEAGDEIPEATVRGMGRYQEYRHAKRRSVEYRGLVHRREKELSETAEALQATKAEELQLSLHVRQFLRDNRYANEKKADTALKALRGYQIRLAQHRQKYGASDVARGKLGVVEARLGEERDAYHAYLETLAQFLERAGVASYEQYSEKADIARKYLVQSKELSGLEDQLTTLLGKQTLDELRVVPEIPSEEVAVMSHTVAELRQDSATVINDIEDRRKEEHKLHLAIAERGARTRTLNEVDEERAAIEERVRQLDWELQAATHARNVLEEVTREQHSRMAPKLATLASAYLSEITDGAYGELTLSREMQISVRIPQTNRLNPDPELCLSKGTIDQVYLALRLAMVQSLSANEESIPLLLDDPFANYDDARLERALRLLTRIAETNQVLLFTCREDIVRLGKTLSMPIIRI